MPIIIKDPAERAPVKHWAHRVLQHFSNRLTIDDLLCYFDDKDYEPSESKATRDRMVPFRKYERKSSLLPPHANDARLAAAQPPPVTSRTSKAASARRNSDL